MTATVMLYAGWLSDLLHQHGEKDARMLEMVLSFSWLFILMATWKQKGKNCVEQEDNADIDALHCQMNKEI